MENIKLTPKKVSSYLFCGAKIKTYKGDIFELLPSMLGTIDNENKFYYWFVSQDSKLILHPLSDLKKEIEHNGERFVPADRLDIIDCGELLPNTSMFREPDCLNLEGQSWKIMQKLFEWHFDVYGLIEKGEAIDINTLKTKQS